jgi:hypothetical protein
MNNLIKFAVVAIAFILPAVSVACEYPERPDLPDGGTATKDDMIAAQKSVKEFLANVDGYLMCIEKEEKAAVDAMDLDSENEEDQETLKRRDELLTKRFDAANEEKFMLGEKWNQQVRAYNAARQASKSE